MLVCKIHYIHLRCPLIWCEVEPTQRLANNVKEFKINNDMVTCKYDSYHFQRCLIFFSAMKSPHGTAPNGYSCGESMVMKF